MNVRMSCFKPGSIPPKSERMAALVYSSPQVVTIFIYEHITVLGTPLTYSFRLQCIWIWVAVVGVIAIVRPKLDDLLTISKIVIARAKHGRSRRWLRKGDSYEIHRFSRSDSSVSSSSRRHHQVIDDSRGRIFDYT